MSASVTNLFFLWIGSGCGTPVCSGSDPVNLYSDTQLCIGTMPVFQSVSQKQVHIFPLPQLRKFGLTSDSLSRLYGLNFFDPLYYMPRKFCPIFILPRTRLISIPGITLFFDNQTHLSIYILHEPELVHTSLSRYIEQGRHQAKSVNLNKNP